MLKHLFFESPQPPLGPVGGSSEQGEAEVQKAAAQGRSEEGGANEDGARPSVRVGATILGGLLQVEAGPDDQEAVQRFVLVVAVRAVAAAADNTTTPAGGRAFSFAPRELCLRRKRHR